MLILQFQLWQDFPENVHCSFLAQCRQISTNKAVRHCCKLLEINILCQWHVPCVNLQNLQPARLVRDANGQLAIKSSWTPERWIKRIWPICCCNDDNFSTALQAIHDCKQLC